MRTFTYSTLVTIGGRILFWLALTASAAGIIVLLRAPYVPVHFEVREGRLNIGSLERPDDPDLFLCAGIDTPLSVENFALEVDDFIRYPEFVGPRDEARWWERQQELYTLLSTHTQLTFHVSRGERSPIGIPINVTTRSPLVLLKDTGFIYLAMLVYLVAARIVSRRSTLFSDRLSGFLFTSIALYLACAAAVIERGLALPTTAQHLFMSGIYLGAAGLISLVHFSWIFPARIWLLEKWPWLPKILYTYMGVTCALYFSGFIGFAGTFPFLVFWTVVMLASLLYSCFHLEQPDIRHHVALSALGPTLLGILFIAVTILPGVFRTSPMDFGAFALFSTIMPMSLTFSTESFRMFRQRQAVEDAREHERTVIARELHDYIGNDLTSMRYLSDSAAIMVKQQPAEARRLIGEIGQMASSTISRLKDFIWAMDTREVSWSDTLDHIRTEAERMISLSNAELRFIAQIENSDASAPTRIRYHLQSICREAVSNAVKHSGARNIRLELIITRHRLLLSIADDGLGFTLGPEANRGHGLKNMRHRAQSLESELRIFTGPGDGTLIKLVVRLSDKKG
ncbi:MAG: hypothetical protein KJ626_12140 [Verrucomicrobia bacterium]|nr:hypothetical protein [Verrucomicrobiota bacterium]